MDEHNNTQAAIFAGMELGDVRFVDDTPFVVVPNEAKVIDLGHMLKNPLAPSGTVALRDAESFIRVVNDHKSDATRIYSSREKFVAVFDEHVRGLPGWRRHRAMYNCPLSAEWQTWTKADGTKMSQEQFALFVEDNLPDIATPPAAEMLEISRSLEAKKKVNFASGVRLSNGQNELTYEETVSGTAGKGKLTVPEEFTVGIPVLEGGPRYAVTARLRYRINEGRLVIWYDLLRPHKIVEDAIKEVATVIASQTDVVILNGEAG